MTQCSRYYKVNADFNEVLEWFEGRGVVFDTQELDFHIETHITYISVNVVMTPVFLNLFSFQQHQGTTFARQGTLVKFIEGNKEDPLLSDFLLSWNAEKANEFQRKQIDIYLNHEQAS